MLNSDTLTQLAQLKQNIHDEMDYAEGIVRGTLGRHGFVSLDDGREAYLSPDIMEQLLPGDRIKVSCSKNENKKWQAKLEKFISTEFKECVGTYRVKGNHHFVAIDHPQTTRWLFVPPKSRHLGKQSLQQGDLVLCRVNKHPYGHGKGQVNILKRLGTLKDIGIERQYVIAKNDLRNEWSQQQQQQVKDITQNSVSELNNNDSLLSNRTDLTHLPFVTIDSEFTFDMDDAIYVEKLEQHWQLHVAIADPSAFIPASSPIDQEARKRSASVYFPSHCIPMLPSELAQKHLSLIAGEKRLALVCKLKVKFDGTIDQFEFLEGIICSQQKLSYSQVAAHIDHQEKLIAEENNSSANHAAIKNSIQELATLATARRQYRSQNNLVQEHKTNFFFKLNKQQKIETIEERTSTSAHRLVEEAMLATNICAGEFFAQHQSSALFTVHKGFREARINDIEKLLLTELPDFESKDLTELENFRALFRELISKSDTNDTTNSYNILLEVLRRLLQPGEITVEANSHYGLGIKHYALVTSPIRRYPDLHNHRVLKQLLHDQRTDNKASGDTGDVSNMSDTAINSLRTTLSNNRQAIKQLDQWLICQFLQDKKGQTFSATINAVSNQGLGIRLKDTGIESFIALRNSKNRPVKFNSQTMTMVLEEENYHLEKAVNVKLEGIDSHQKRLDFRIIKPQEINPVDKPAETPDKK